MNLFSDNIIDKKRDKQNKDLAFPHKCLLHFFVLVHVCTGIWVRLQFENTELVEKKNIFSLFQNLLHWNFTIFDNSIDWYKMIFAKFVQKRRVNQFLVYSFSSINSIFYWLSQKWFNFFCIVLVSVMQYKLRAKISTCFNYYSRKCNFSK